MESCRVDAIGAHAFVKLSQGQYRNNGENGCCGKQITWQSASLLLVDGLDRVTNWSNRTEDDLAALLEYRYKRKRPVIWTTNAPSDRLWSRMRLDEDSRVAMLLTQSTRIWAE